MEGETQATHTKVGEPYLRHHGFLIAAIEDPQHVFAMKADEKIETMAAAGEPDEHTRLKHACGRNGVGIGRT